MASIWPKRSGADCFPRYVNVAHFREQGFATKPQPASDVVV